MKNLRFLVVTAVSIGLLWWVFSQLEPTELRVVMSDIQPKFAGVLVLMSVMIIFLTAFRWYGVMLTSDKRIDFGMALKTSAVGNTLNSVLPSKGGDLAKGLLSRQITGWSYGVGAVVAERLVDLTVLGVIGITGYWWYRYTLSLVVGGCLIGTGLVGLGVGMGVEKSGKASKWLPKMLYGIASEVGRVVRGWRVRPRSLLITGLGSVAVWMVNLSVVKLLAMSLGAEVELAALMALTPVVVVVTLLPISLAGLGTREVAFVSLFGALVSEEAGLVMGLGYGLFTYWLVGLVGLPWFYREVAAYLRRARKRRK